MLCIGVSHYFYVTQYACHLGGFVVIPLPPAQGSADTLHYLASKAAPAAVIASVHNINYVSSCFTQGEWMFYVEDNSGPYESLPWLRDATVSGMGSSSHYQLNKVWRNDHHPLCQIVQRSSESLLMLLPTSGSTGRPKLVMITEGMVLRQCVPPSFGALTVMVTFRPLRQSMDLVVKGTIIFNPSQYFV